MTTMIDYLLNSSRLIDNGAQLYFHPHEVDLRALLREVCHLHREIAPRSPSSQRLGTAGTTTLPVFGDSKLLFQMFSNLISNAVKYSDDGRHINVTADADIESEKIVVTVQDHGIGIPQKDLAHVFGRYNRGSNVSGIVGTGVGLYLVKIVIDLHGGSVAVESTEGEGSRFTVRLADVAPDPNRDSVVVGASCRLIPVSLEVVTYAPCVQEHSPRAYQSRDAVCVSRSALRQKQPFHNHPILRIDRGPEGDLSQ
jgi:two-component system OmpR family sensor kinase